MRRVLCFSDVHVPFHDKTCWRLLLKVVELGWDEIVINGDFMDCLAVSFHPKNPGRKYALADEIAAGNTCLDQLQAVSGKAKITYLGGNHEHRLERYIAEKAKELHGLDATTIPGLLFLQPRGITWIPYKRASYKVGKLSFIHDLGRSGVNTARQSLNDFGGNIVVGHSHRIGIVYQGTVRGESHVGINSGWLGDVTEADYMHLDKARRDWHHGFAVAYIENNGNAHVQAVPIIGRTCVVDGKLVRV
jgi:hypothetical protein